MNELRFGCYFFCFHYGSHRHVYLQKSLQYSVSAFSLYDKKHSSFRSIAITRCYLRVFNAFFHEHFWCAYSTSFSVNTWSQDCRVNHKCLHKNTSNLVFKYRAFKKNRIASIQSQISKHFFCFSQVCFKRMLRKQGKNHFIKQVLFLQKRFHRFQGYTARVFNGVAVRTGAYGRKR